MKTFVRLYYNGLNAHHTIFTVVKMLPVRLIRLPRLICLALILYFWAVGAAGLERFPKVFEDESWIAAPG